MSEYVIREPATGLYVSGAEGPPTISVGSQKPDFVRYATHHVGLAWRFPDKESAEKTAQAFMAENPGRYLEVVPAPGE